MGAVYRARVAGTQQEIALKVLHGPAPSLDAEALERFRREALLAARVRHRGVVPIHDAGEVGGIPYVAMGLVAGRPLAELEVGEEQFLRVLAKVGRAVGAAHRAGVVHRDLKPTNVIVDGRTLEPTVVDFGLAFDARNELTRLSKTGEVMGTPAYMAPETIRGKARPDDARLDVYALGLMLHERLSRGYPFPGRTAAVLFEQILRGVPPLPRTVAPWLADLAGRACALDPEKRPVNGDAFAEELESGLAGKRPVPRRRPVALVVVSAALGLVVLGGGAVAIATWASAPPAPSPPAPAPPRPVAPPPAPVAPPPAPAKTARIMPEDVAAEVQASIELGFAGGPATDEEQEARNAELKSLFKRAPELAERYPDDGRTLVLSALAIAHESGREHALRRDMMAGIHRGPVAPWACDLVGRFSHMLGFERASADVGELELRPGAELRPARLVFLPQLYLKAAPPVANPKRAEEVCAQLLAVKTPATANEYPETWMVEDHRAWARVALLDNPGAASFFERAAEAAPDDRTRLVTHAEAERARAGALDPSAAGASIRLCFATTPFLRQIMDLDLARPDIPGQRTAAEDFERLAGPPATPEQAALALLRAARAHAAGAQRDRAREALERAGALPLGAPDTRALVARALARALLETNDTARAEQLALEAAADANDPDSDPRTPGERADAWVLVARARLARGDRARAIEALEAAAKLATDRREIEELRGR
jgi:tetratricopeptide (TPR) repeat protein